MPENMTKNPNEQAQLDDELAKFADQIMGGEQPEVPLMEEGKNQELAELMETVVVLERVFSAERPDPAMSKRIKANLLKEWEISGPAAQPDSFWKRLWSGETWAPQRVTGLVSAIGVAALVVIAAALIPSFSGGGLEGSAGNPGSSIDPVPVVGGLVVLAGVLWWLSRRRR
jgi:hypothetical protein